MTVKDLVALYDYGYWANRKILDVVARLTPDEFTQTVGGSYGSIRNTLVHTMSAEAGWLERCGGPKRGPKLNATDFPTADSVVLLWTKVEANMRGFLATLADADLARDVEYTVYVEKRAMRLDALLRHAAIHGVHHRGQVALLLRMLGKVPGDFDLLFYEAEQRGVRAV
jgi:uncharacterized damage-inducible protein DinB